MWCLKINLEIIKSEIPDRKPAIKICNKAVIIPFKAAFSYIFIYNK